MYVSEEGNHAVLLKKNRGDCQIMLWDCLCDGVSGVRSGWVSPSTDWVVGGRGWGGGGGRTQGDESAKILL